MKKGNQATDMMDDMVDYEDEPDFDDTIFDEWMDFNDVGMNECNSPSELGDEGSNDPPNATHNLLSS